MKDFIIKELIAGDIEQELHQIGFDEGYAGIAALKFRYRNIKLYNLTPEQANIIKQTALTVGADCATHRDVIRGGIEHSDAILGGSLAQLNKICDKLKHQPFGLKYLAEKLEKNVHKGKTTKLAGILNVTPDSFSDGGKYLDEKSACEHLMEMINDGADIIDIGAESTRPFSDGVTPSEQIKRLTPILKFIQKENIKTPISIDTRSSEVADFVLNNGASIINDVSGFDYDKRLPNIVSKYNAKIIIQHSKGTPENMQNKPQYNNLIDEIYFSLKTKIEYANSLGITEIIIDPGIGFGKTREDNFEILKRIEEFYSLNCPIMVGVSRKSLLGIKDSDNDIKDTFTLALSYPLIQKGVDVLRVHNVKLHKKFIEIIT